MSLKTKQYNKEFMEIECQFKNEYENNKKNKTKSGTLSTVANTMLSVGENDDEDDQERYNRIQAMKDANMDYSGITKQVLKNSGVIRVSSVAHKYLKSRSGPGAWG